MPDEADKKALLETVIKETIELRQESEELRKIISQKTLELRTARLFQEQSRREMLEKRNKRSQISFQNSGFISGSNIDLINV